MTVVPHSEAIVQAQAEGTSAVRVDHYDVLREQILRMCRAISEAAGLTYEK